MLDHVRDLMAHAEWANAVFFHAWGKSPARDHEEMRRRVEHVVLVREVSLRVLRGGAGAGPRDAPPPSLEERKAGAQPSHAALIALAGSLDAAGLERQLRIPWFPDPPCVISAAGA